MVVQNVIPNSQVSLPAARPEGVKAAVEPPAQKALPKVSIDELKQAVVAINQAMQQSSHDLQFSVDNESHKTVVRVVDSNTGDLIRQIPTDTALAISRDIDHLQRGLLFNHTA